MTPDEPTRPPAAPPRERALLLRHAALSEVGGRDDSQTISSDANRSHQSLHGGGVESAALTFSATGWTHKPLTIQAGLSSGAGDDYVDIGGEYQRLRLAGLDAEVTVRITDDDPIHVQVIDNNLTLSVGFGVDMAVVYCAVGGQRFAGTPRGSTCRCAPTPTPTAQWTSAASPNATDTPAHRTPSPHPAGAAPPPTAAPARPRRPARIGSARNHAPAAMSVRECCCPANWHMNCS